MGSSGHWHYPGETERRKWQNPERILSEIELKDGNTLIDIGCGNGFFTLPAARIVGAKGKVYWLDTNDEAIGFLRRKASTEGLNNLELKVGAAEDTLFCRSCAEIVFFGLVLHDFNNPSRVIENARKMLKPEGMLVNLDWKKIDMGFGPPLAIRFDENTASRLIESAGFKVEILRDSGSYHYLIMARLRN
jgi:ubiquinone/menaquinone biosynthesis C-methylase UbiE